MPRVALTAAQKRAQRTADGNTALLKALRRNKAEEDLKWDEVAGRLGVAPSTLQRWRQRPEIIPLCGLRAIVETIGMSKEDWLKVGGFRP